MEQRTLHADVEAKLKEFKAENPGLRKVLDEAWGYAVFPEVGKASLIVGGSYGQGEVFEKKKLIGYATISQFTVGVQVGGDTFSELVLFESRDSLDRFKAGKVEFAANASAVLVRAGTAKVNDYEQGVKTMALSSGGMLLEAAIGGQKFTFRPATEAEQSGGLKKRSGTRRKEQPGKRSSAAKKKSAQSARHARPGASKRRAAARPKKR